jgi:hypothetical protein
MGDPSQSDADSIELRGLVERIERGDSVLVPGPRLADHADHGPLDELPASELLANLDLPEGALRPSPVGLRRARDSMKKDANTPLPELLGRICS